MVKRVVLNLLLAELVIVFVAGIITILGTNIAKCETPVQACGTDAFVSASWLVVLIGLPCIVLTCIAYVISRYIGSSKK